MKACLMLLLAYLASCMGKITLHVVCHTHDDTGWLATVDQYYYSEVRFILDTVVAALNENPHRKFNYVEMAFFSRWWDDASSWQRVTMKKLVQNKQLEFLNGGWCMHDEAGPLYNEMVDQTTRGHQFILREFGADAAPKATWQIDPFGHTNTQAWLLAAEAGMPSMFWGRMDGNDLNARKKTQNLEYIWRGSKSLGENAETFGSELYGDSGEGLYGCPTMFEEYDFVHKDKHVHANPNRHDYNVEMFVNKTVDFVLEQRKSFRTDHVLWSCGFDFAFRNAYTWYRNLDAIMEHVNKDGRINMIYSSPHQYVDAINKDKNKYKFQVRTDDLMPLHEWNHVYWTGYFSSRVAFKRLVRRSWNLLYVARQVAFLTDVSPGKSVHPSPRVGTSWTDHFEGALSVAMHHDGISGTAKQNVNGDYAQRISEGQQLVEAGLDAGLKVLLNSPKSTFEYCRDLNISVCTLTTEQSGNGFSMIAWNPRGQTATAYTFRVPVSLSEVEGSISVKFNGKQVRSQLLSIDSVTARLPLLYINSFGLSEEQVQATTVEYANKASHVLTFQTDVPPMGFASLNFEPSSDTMTTTTTLAVEGDGNDEFGNGMYKITLDPETKAVKSITNLESGLSTDLELEWGWYESAPSTCTYTGCADWAVSGAYLFRPNSSAYNYPGPKKPVKTEIVQGDVVTEIRQQVSDWVYHVIRLEKGKPYVEVEYTVGPIPITNEWLDDPVKAKQEIGKEVTLRYKTGITRTNSSFYTDSNGLEMVKRVRNARPASYPQDKSWEDEPIASNFYPVNAMISLCDGEKAFTVVSDSTQGGTSLNDGQLELMVHRRLFHDDFKGVEEPLNETMCGCNGMNDAQCYCSGLAVRGVHHIVFGDSGDVRKTSRQVNANLQFRPVTLFTADSNIPSIARSYLVQELPENVHLLTLNSNYDGKVILRLQHIYAIGEDPQLSKPVTVNLRDLLQTHQITHAEEVTLTANNPIDKKYSYEWNYETPTTSQAPKRHPFNQTSLSVTLNPMEIRTFLIRTNDPTTATTS